MVQKYSGFAFQPQSGQKGRIDTGAAETGIRNREPREGTRTIFTSFVYNLFFLGLEIENPERGREPSILICSSHQLGLEIENPERGREHIICIH